MYGQPKSIFLMDLNVSFANQEPIRELVQLVKETGYESRQTSKLKTTVL